MAVACPECGAFKSMVDKNNTSADHRLVVRKRTCENGHHFETAERLNGMPIDNVLIRKAGDQQLAEGPFNRSLLLDEVRTGVLKTKRWAEGKDVSVPVALAIEDLELRLSSIAKPLTAKSEGNGLDTAWPSWTPTSERPLSGNFEGEASDWLTCFTH